MQNQKRRNSLMLVAFKLFAKLQASIWPSTLAVDHATQLESFQFHHFPCTPAA
jgi:hypothetical protein